MGGIAYSMSVGNTHAMALASTVTHQEVSSKIMFELMLALKVSNTTSW